MLLALRLREARSARSCIYSNAVYFVQQGAHASLLYLCGLDRWPFTRPLCADRRLCMWERLPDVLSSGNSSTEPARQTTFGGLKKGTHNATQIHPIRQALEDPIGNRFWCDDTHHEIGGLLPNLSEGPERRCQNIEQVRQTTFAWSGSRDYLALWLNCPILPCPPWD